MDRVVTDKAGRRLSLRKVGVLETLRLFKALGPELSSNQSYLGVASVAVSVSMIDDVPIPFPVTEAGVEALIGRVGDEAMNQILAEFSDEPAEQIVAMAGN